MQLHVEPFGLVSWCIHLEFMLSYAVTASDLHKLQQQIKHLVELIQKLTMEFGAVKAELEDSRVDVDSIRETLNGLLGVNT